jgi:hypothetical protein
VPLYQRQFHVGTLALLVQLSILPGEPYLPSDLRPSYLNV